MAINSATLAVVAWMRQQIRSLTDAEVARLTAAWVEAWDELAPEFSAALTDLLSTAEGTRVPASMVARSRRVQDALTHAEAVLVELSRHTDSILVDDLARVILDAAEGHVQVLQSQLPTADIRAVDFTRTDPQAMAAIVDRSTQQITSRTLPIPAEQAQVMRQSLIRGIFLGEHPDAVARRILRRTEWGFNGGLARAARIARTEMLDAHREAARRNAVANRDILTGWVWQATLDTDTCISCLANHGREYPVEEFGPIDHPNGRCARVDKVKSMSDLLGLDLDEPDDAIPDAQAWFDALPRADQLAIMGSPKRLDLYLNGDVAWGDLTVRKTNPDWRDSMIPTPVPQLT